MSKITFSFSQKMILTKHRTKQLWRPCIPPVQLDPDKYLDKKANKHVNIIYPLRKMKTNNFANAEEVQETIQQINKIQGKYESQMNVKKALQEVNTSLTSSGEQIALWSD